LPLSRHPATGLGASPGVGSVRPSGARRPHGLSQLLQTSETGLARSNRKDRVSLLCLPTRITPGDMRMNP
jgi:hypothetical protein